MADDDAYTSWVTYLSVDTCHLAEWVVDRGSGSCSHRSDKRTFISVGCLICTGTSPANIHDMETWLHTTGRGATWRVMQEDQNEDMSENLRQKGLTGCYGESRAGVALSQTGGWELRRGQSSLLHQSTTSSSAGPQTLYGLPSLLASHYLPDSSPSSPGLQTFYC